MRIFGCTILSIAEMMQIFVSFILRMVKTMGIFGSLIHCMVETMEIFGCFALGFIERSGIGLVLFLIMQTFGSSIFAIVKIMRVWK